MSHEAVVNLVWLGAEGANTGLLLWMIGLFALAFALAALEVFIPSGGVLGAAAMLSAIGAVGVAFRIGPLSGLTALGFVVVATPAVIWLSLQVFPNTPIGRRIILNEGMSEEEIRGRAEEKAAQSAAITALVGARGVALSDLRPGGQVRIEGEDVEAFSEIGFISSGTTVEVTSVMGRQIKVRPASTDHPTAPPSEGA